MQKLKKAARVLGSVAECSGMNAKMAILGMYKDDDDIRKIIKAIYNPFSKSGLSDSKLDKALETVDRGDRTILETDAIIEYFERHQTGRQADAMLAAKFVAGAERYRDEEPFIVEVARGIVTNDLQIGVNVTTFNKVFGKNFIPKFGCMLGKPYEDVAATTAGVQWPCIATEKLDGVRRILIKQGGACRIYSRTGHEDTGLTDIIEEATKYLPDNAVYDGELLARGLFSDSIALRQATNSIAARSGEKKNVVFNVFDMVPINDFFGETISGFAIDRKCNLACLLGDYEGAKLLATKLGLEHFEQVYIAYNISEHLEHIRPVPILGICHSIVEATPLAEAIWNAGGEGIMLNTTHGLYETKRSSALLKLKHTEEYALKIVAFEEGTGKFEGMLGALVLEYGSGTVKVGSGFTDDQRRVFWDKSNELLGKYAEIDCFGKSSNKKGGESLSCPIFKRIKGTQE